MSYINNNNNVCKESSSPRMSIKFSALDMDEDIEEKEPHCWCCTRTRCIKFGLFFAVVGLIAGGVSVGVGLYFTYGIDGKISTTVKPSIGTTKLPPLVTTKFPPMTTTELPPLTSTLSGETTEGLPTLTTENIVTSTQGETTPDENKTTPFTTLLPNTTFISSTNTTMASFPISSTKPPISSTSTSVSILSTTTTFQWPECNKDEFQCRSGQCIQQSLQCDGNPNCHDKTDEYNCTDCTGFTCDDGLCIPRIFSKCNGVFDCLDLSDEKNCGERAGYVVCKNNVSIAQHYRCDGFDDCGDNSDEENCKCSFDKYDCPDGKCIWRSWVCDGYADCINGTDELNCGATCTDKQYKCSDHTCKDLTTKCDGVSDCPDRADEKDCVTLGRDSNLEDLKITYEGRQYYFCSQGWSKTLSEIFCHHEGFDQVTKEDFVLVTDEKISWFTVTETNERTLSNRTARLVDLFNIRQNMANRKRVFSALEVLSAIAESEDKQITSSDSSYHPPESELQDVEDLSSSDSDLVLENNKPVEKNTRLSRKRIRDPVNWKQNIRKRYRNAGREYISRKGKKVPEKVFDEYICCCRLKCGDRIGLENKRAIFNHFYDLDWEGQTQFIASSVQVVQIKSRTVQRPEKSRRQSSRIYYLTDERIRVCKNTFLHTLSVTNKRVDYAVRFKTVPGTTLVTPDQRGKKVPSNKTSDSMIDSIKEHISSFPKFCSHYGRSESSRNYLDPQLSLTRMYELYCEDCKKNMRKPASKWVYSNIFDREYNLHFYKLKKDTCKTCDQTNNSIKYMPDGKEREELVKTLEDHQKRGKQAHEKLKEDIGKANNNQQYKVFTFDLERTLPTPYLNTNEVFYLRQLWVYNLGIHEYPENQAIMNMWDECQAGRGPEDIASCIRSYLESHLSDNNTQVTTYSDSCGGQNRNYPMARFMMHTVNTLKNLQQIDMKFMESGHSFLPNDSDFSHVSNLLKKTTHIFSLKEWEELVSKSNKTRPFIVNHMDGKFYSWKDLDRILINRKKNENSENVKWLQIKWLRFCRGSLKMLYKTSLDDTTEFECVDFCRNKRAFDASLAKFCAFSPRFAYLNRRPIKLQKYTDLQKLLKYIPPIHHEFFINLPHEQAEDDHFPHPDIMSDEYEGED